jgi:hypothetical protein
MIFQQLLGRSGVIRVGDADRQLHRRRVDRRHTWI